MVQAVSHVLYGAETNHQRLDGGAARTGIVCERGKGKGKGLGPRLRIQREQLSGGRDMLLPLLEYGDRTPCIRCSLEELGTAPTELWRPRESGLMVVGGG